MKTILILLLLIGSADAAILYVDKDVGCPGSGTDGSPYCSIANAVAVVNAGDTIRIRDAASAYSETVSSSTSGTSGSRITVEPDTGHNPTIHNAGAGGSCATFWLHGSYWTIQNLNFDATGVTPCNFGAILVHADVLSNQSVEILNNTFKGWGGAAHTGEPAAGRSASALFISGGALGPSTGFWPTNTLIEGNTFDANRTKSVSLVHTDGTIFRNNEFKNGTCGRNSDGSAVIIGIHAIYYNKNLTVAGNDFHDWDAHVDCGVTTQLHAVWAGYWCDVGDSGSDGTIIIEGNRVYNIDQNKNTFANSNGLSHESVGLFVEHECNRHVLKNNIIYDIGTTGIKFRQTAVGGTTNKVYYNTVYSVGAYSIRSTDAGLLDVRGNIFTTAGAQEVTLEGSACGPAHTWDYNLYDSSTSVGNCGATTNASLATWKALAFAPDVNSPTPAGAQFVSAPSDFTLLSTSPARNVGVTISSVTNDYNSVARPQGGAYDIGALELFTHGSRLRGTVVQ